MGERTVAGSETKMTKAERMSERGENKEILTEKERERQERDSCF